MVAIITNITIAYFHPWLHEFAFSCFPKLLPYRLNHICRTPHAQILHVTWCSALACRCVESCLILSYSLGPWQDFTSNPC